ncbi:MAG: OB-fold nucleic acid binding domain-containing protein, partial [Streptosporangiaceae bacterium]|nr:OB-fold nucleic acid binding domain-containing protein [Streptosporangiaceae bacterium]
GTAPNLPNYARWVVLVFVDDFDLSTIAALRYARSLRPTTLRAVHFVIDTDTAEQLRAAWLPDRNVTLEFIDTPDRRVTRAAAELVSKEVELAGTQVTVILPRRSFSPLLGRLLHDRTADKIAVVVSRIPNAAATIIPFDVQNRVRVLQERHAAREGKAGQAVLAPAGGGSQAATEDAAERQHMEAAVAAATPHEPRRVEEDRPGKAGGEPGKRAQEPEPLPGAGGYGRPVPPPDVTPIGSLHEPGRAAVEGRVRMLELRPVEHNSVLVAEISDSTGDLTAMFYGRSNIPGLMCGSKVRFRGTVGIRDGAPVMINPAYELLLPGGGKKPRAGS